MKLMIPLLLILWPLLLVPAAADTARSSTLTADQLTVRDLMQLDAELALEAARRRRLAGASDGAPGSTPRVDQTGAARAAALRLIGIYGVGKRLFAEVRAGENGLLFMKGQPNPIGYGNDPDGYRLRALEGRCIHLVRHAEETRLCLSGRKE